MTDLTPMGALGSAQPAKARFGALTLSEDTSLTLLSLALPGDSGQIADLTLPGPGSYASAREIAAFWTGPGQWMIESANGEAARAAIAALPGARTTEQSDGWVVIRIRSDSGPAPLLALAEKLVNLPAAALAPGRATRCQLHHLNCLVTRPDASELRVMTLRSAAGSLWHALGATAARVNVT